MDASCRIRAARSADLPAIHDIETAAFGDPWPAALFRVHLADVFLVAEIDGAVVGYLVARPMGGEGEILNVAVAGDARRRGIARTLLAAALAALAEAGVATLFLEVRRSNTPARELYESAGFRLVGTRRGYYRSPREDALVFRHDAGLAR